MAVKAADHPRRTESLVVFPVLFVSTLLFGEVLGLVPTALEALTPEAKEAEALAKPDPLCEAVPVGRGDKEVAPAPVVAGLLASAFKDSVPVGAEASEVAVAVLSAKTSFCMTANEGQLEEIQSCWQESPLLSHLTIQAFAAVTILT